MDAEISPIEVLKKQRKPRQKKIEDGEPKPPVVKQPPFKVAPVQLPPVPSVPVAINDADIVEFKGVHGNEDAKLTGAEFWKMVRTLKSHPTEGPQKRRKREMGVDEQTGDFIPVIGHYPPPDSHEEEYYVTQFRCMTKEVRGPLLEEVKKYFQGQ